MPGGSVMLMQPEWTAGRAADVVAMWIAMMAAMMLPGAGPAVIDAVRRGAGRSSGSGGLATARCFILWYVRQFPEGERALAGAVNLARYYDRHAARPSFTVTIPPPS